MSTGQTSELTRIMLAIDGQPCRFGCTYCFAQFSQYEPPMTLNDVLRKPELVHPFDVIYPACDTDLFARNDFEYILEKIVEFGKSISISTKANINNRAIKALISAASELRKVGAVVKVGISISTKHRIPEIEPRTPGYRSRIRSLSRLNQEGIISSLVLRPLLADISNREYEEILRDCHGSTKHVLIGDEWLDASDHFRAARGADANFVISVGTVNWARNNPTWRQRSIPGRRRILEDYGRPLGYRFFDSDLALMEDIITRG